MSLVETISSPAPLARLASTASVEATPRAALAARDLGAMLPEGGDLYIPHLPGAAFEATWRAAAAAAGAGLRPVPHVSARGTRAADVLTRELQALRETGADAAMLVGGGGVQEGPFADAEALLASGALQRAGFRRLGLAAHPEGHPHADAAALDRALDAKLRLARGFAEEVWLVTQFAFEAAPVLDWLARLRRREPDILVRVGVSGPARPATLLAYAARCGVGASLQALKGRPGLIGRMTRRWRPDALAGRLAEAAAAGETGPIALHLFPFGGLEATADWLEEARA